MEIKYDLKFLRRNKGFLAILLAILVVDISIAFLDLSISSMDFIALVVGFVVFCCFGISVFTYTKAYAYMCSLEKAGYVIPEDKKMYNALLENLPRNISEKLDTSLEYSYSNFSKLAKKYTWILMAIFCLLEIVLYIKWHFLGDAIIISSLFRMIIISLSWYALGDILGKQSDTKKYRDNEEVDTNRGKRWAPNTVGLSFVVLLFLCLFIYFISCFVVKLVVSSTI